MRPIHLFPHQHNRRLFVAGIALLLLGYLCLNQPPASGFLSHTLAPILLTLSYVVLIPASLLFKPQKPTASPPAHP